MSLTPMQRWGIAADLSIIRAMGFAHVRILTFTKGGDPYYAPWPAVNFLSFPTPTVTELANFGEFLAMTKAFGLTVEIVLVMADHDNLYYQNGVQAGDYLSFVNSIWTHMWAGALNRVYLGGDLRLGDHDDPAITASHRQFITDVWPHFVARGSQVGLGIEIRCQNASFWDRGADSLAWIRANMTARPPNYVGGQLYPTSHAALKILGFEGPSGMVDWNAMTLDWITNMRAAAGPSIEVFADEVGISLSPIAPSAPLPDFTPADQAAFLSAALSALTTSGMRANVWEFADEPGLSQKFGLQTAQRGRRPAVAKLAAPLAEARAAGLLPGICYQPPEMPDLSWMMPE